MAFFVAFLCLIGLAVVHPSHAQNSQQDYLDAHNTARAQVGVTNIIWNSTVAAYAQSYANSRISDCNLVHSGGPYGENLAKGTGSFSGTAAVNLWVAEKPYYDYASNACTGGKECRHYTQVVWANSLTVGCARVQCTNSWWFVICNYYTPGNYIGQRPY
ncbi:pathogenesis-related leaf protein 6-like [Argentina anserina]|uniref:pathogenesis-related leaf protein 6-like n=1 Tax=Argentina anserina TaxID=57926 RepID=UPI002176493A|nr:pathogenesis-related leaf protein 6-like [Potentilla anserina]